MSIETPPLKMQTVEIVPAQVTPGQLANPVQPIKVKDLITIGAIVVIWGIAFVGMKEILHSSPPFKAAGLRFIIAGLCLLPFTLRPSRLRQLRPIDFVKFATLGFLQTTLLFGIIFFSLQYVPAGISSIILNTNPFFVAIFAHFVIKGDQLTRQKIIGLLVGFSGVMVLVLAGGKSLGDVAWYWPLILLVASLVWATSTILVKLFRFRDMLTVTAWQTFLGSLPLLAIGFLFETKPIDFNWSFGLWLLYIAVPGSAFAWWAWNGMVQRYSASRVSVFLFLIPVCGVLGGVLLLGESLSYSLLIGGALVASGIILVNLRLRRKV